MAIIQNFAVFTFIFALLNSHVMTVLGARITGVVGTSLDGCFDECKMRMSCVSLVYNRRTTYCTLYDEVIPEYQGQRIKGLEYADVETQPEMIAHSESCNGQKCTVGQTCDDTVCTYTECKPPVAPLGATAISGNLWTIGSKIAYRCIQSNAPRFPTCQASREWSLGEFFCKRSNFTHSMDDHFMPADTLGGNINASMTFDGLSRDECLARCAENNDFCITFNYEPANESCVLSNLQLGRNTEPGVNVVPRTGWEIFHRAVPITFHRENGQQYKFTLTEGVEYCKSIGTSIASRADVEHAYNLGYNVCSCSWVEEGYSMLLIHFPISSCLGSRIGALRCWGGTHFDVFCKNTDF